MLPHGQGGGFLFSGPMKENHAEKGALRAAIDRLRAGLSPEEIARRSLAAKERLFSLPPLREARPGATIALYLPLPGELDTTAIFEGLASRGFRCAFPRVERGDPLLLFFPLAPGEAVERGPLGVRQPPARGEIPLEAIDLFLVPGQAFDRLGGVIFETEDPYGVWDGTIRDQLPRPGVYVYRSTYRLPYQDEQEVMGTVTLLK